MATIDLLRVDQQIFNNSYEHVADFQSPSTQRYYFDNKVITSFNKDIVVQPSRISVTCPYPYRYFLDNSINYVRAFDNSRYYYYFITDIIFTAQARTELLLELDVWQTYLWNYSVLDSIVERCHVRRWNDDGTPTKESLYADENIPTGEYIMEKGDSDYNIESLSNTVVIASTIPIGILTKNNGGGGTNPPSGSDDCGDWRNGVMSRNGFRFMKGYEGFGAYLYKDSGGVPTIGYGVTKSEPKIFDDLVSRQPVPEEYASQVSYKLKQTNYGKPIVDFCKKIGVTKQNQFDALCDLAFNAGVGAVVGTPNYTSLPNALRKDPFNESYIRPIWEKYIVRDASGNVLNGLKARRKAECDIYFKNLYEFRPIVTINQNGSYGRPITANGGNGWLPECTGRPEGVYVDNKAGNDWLVPVTGTISSMYPAYPSGKPHNAVDIACPEGTPVYASKDGVVRVRKELTTSYGKYLIIAHGDSDVVYAHNSQLLVNVGDNVKQGQMIARSGNTGNSTGPHLHWEIRNPNGEIIQNGVKTVNPMPGYKVGQKV